MATARADAAVGPMRVQVAVFAKAPVPGLAKTRLIPALGATGSARLQRHLTLRALRVALGAGLGPVALWCTPDASHRLFQRLCRVSGVSCRVQPNGDLGWRMHTAFLHHCRSGPLLLMGTDCPPLTPRHLRQATAALLAGDDAVFFPAADGGYVLVGLRAPQPQLFVDMAWSTPTVMADTRARAHGAGLRLREFQTLWDLDTPADLAHLSATDAAALGVGRPLTP